MNDVNEGTPMTRVAQRKRANRATQRAQRRDVCAAARVITALELAVAGHDWQTVADLSGYGNRGTAYKAVQRELERRIDQRVDALRALHLARLGRLRTVYFPKAMAGDGWSCDRVLRIDEREAHLMGLDARAPSSADEDATPYTVVTEVYPSAWVEALATQAAIQQAIDGVAPAALATPPSAEK